MELKIHIIEDSDFDYEIIFHELMKDNLYDNAIKSITRSSSLKSGIEDLSKDNFDILLLDLSLSDTFELSGLEKLNKTFPDLPIIVFTGLDDDETSSKALQIGAQDYLIKGARRKEILRVIRYAIERIKIQSRLKIAEKEAKEASDAKSVFLAAMSHEIRTPLTSIIGFTEMLLKKNSDVNKQLDIVNIIHSNGTHLLEIINDILDLSKIEANELVVEKIETDINKILKDLYNTFFFTANKKSLEYHVNIVNEIPKYIISDPLRLKQILFNLVGNAIKFTDSGSVIINISFNKNLEELEFKIVDTGIGVPDDIASIFKAFSQADSSTTRKYGGTGLGLNISTNLADKLEGKIEAFKNELKGSTFVLRLKASFTKKEFINKFDEKSTEEISIDSKIVNNSDKNLKILIADDNPLNRRLLKNILEKLNYSTVEAKDGEEALKLLKSEEFQIGLIDLEMPKCNGYEVANLEKKVPLVAVTAHIVSEVKDKCLNAGFKDITVKPFNQKEIQGIISSLT